MKQIIASVVLSSKDNEETYYLVPEAGEPERIESPGFPIDETYIKQALANSNSLIEARAIYEKLQDYACLLDLCHSGLLHNLERGIDDSALDLGFYTTSRLITEAVEDLKKALFKPKDSL